jgi:SagB-type dehydrogenase family enzyme
MIPMSDIDNIIRYHERTKHHFYRYANSLGYLDWETQPYPFREWIDSPKINLLGYQKDPGLTYEKLYSNDNDPHPVNIGSISTLFFYSMAISAWKSTGSASWALRVNPSSGNLHPTESYLLINATGEICDTPSVFHYASDTHSLELRRRFSKNAWQELISNSPDGTFFILLTSIPWRESWKYGERAFRYCQHDCGHAIGAIRLACSMLGWSAHLIMGVTDESIDKILGIDDKSIFAAGETEHADCLLRIVPENYLQPGKFEISSGPLPEIINGELFGKPNRLSHDHHEWQVVETAVQSSLRTQSGIQFEGLDAGIPPAAIDNSGSPVSAAQIIRQRRSAVMMDGATGIDSSRFYKILVKLLPQETGVPWDTIPWTPKIHLGMFLHKVHGLSPGIYALIRHPASMEPVKQKMSPDFLWQKPDNCPLNIPLYFLEEKNVQGIASSVSCQQEIAGQGAFSLGMLAEFSGPLNTYGAHFYRCLHWEAGLIGQVLYLEAEAAGLRGTGIGCFFDDPVHDVFGITGNSLQTLYHFTVGGPLDDGRLTTLPAYEES